MLILLLFICLVNASDVCIYKDYQISFKTFNTNGKIIIENNYLQDHTKTRNIDRRIKYLFYKFDLDNNNYLTFEEGKLYQEITSPRSFPMPFEAFKQLCKLLKCSPIKGLNILDFQKTYFLYKYQLNTDLDKDYNTIKNIENNIIMYFKGSYM